MARRAEYEAWLREQIEDAFKRARKYGGTRGERYAYVLGSLANAAGIEAGEERERLWSLLTDDAKAEGGGK